MSWRFCWARRATQKGFILCFKGSVPSSSFTLWASRILTKCWKVSTLPLNWFKHQIGAWIQLMKEVYQTPNHQRNHFPLARKIGHKDNSTVPNTWMVGQFSCHQRFVLTEKKGFQNITLMRYLFNRKLSTVPAVIFILILCQTRLAVHISVFNSMQMIAERALQKSFFLTAISHYFW